MKKLICALITLMFIFVCGCSSSGSTKNTGSAQSEETNKTKAQNLKPAQKTIGDRFRTDLSPVNGLTTKGQQVKITTEQAIKPVKKSIKKPKK